MDGKQLQAARKALHWTQATLGKVCGVHKNTIAKWERNDPRAPQMIEALMLLLAYRDNQALIEKKYLSPT